MFKTIFTFLFAIFLTQFAAGKFFKIDTSNQNTKNIENLYKRFDCPSNSTAYSICSSSCKADPIGWGAKFKVNSLNGNVIIDQYIANSKFQTMAFNNCTVIDKNSWQCLIEKNGRHEWSMSDGVVSLVTTFKNPLTDKWETQYSCFK
jgi:hypothetical protein